MSAKVRLDKRWKEVLFAAAGLGPNLLMTLMMAYFTDAVIPTGLVADVGFWSYGGVIIVYTVVFPILWTIGRFFDGIVDVPLAHLTDTLKTKTGKRWIGYVVSVVPMIISFILCWIPVFGKSADITVGQQVGNSIWIFGWSIIFFASYTLALITFYGSLSDVCANQTQRARVSAYKSVFDTISYALVYAAIPAIFKAVGVPIWQVAIYATPLMLTILIPLTMIRKNDAAGLEEEKSVPFFESIKLTVRSKPFMKWTIVNCVAFFGLQMFLVAQNTLISGIMVLGAGYAAILNTCAFAPVPLMLYLFNKLRRRKGIRFAYQTALLSFGVCILGFNLAGQYFWGDNLMPKLIIGCLTGVCGSWGIGAFFMVPYLIPTSIAAVEEEITGKNHSAMYFAIQALATSIVGAIASSLVYNYIKLWVKEADRNMWQSQSSLFDTGFIPEWKTGVSLVPLIVAIACFAGFFVCFLMPKKYTPKVIYDDIVRYERKALVKKEKKYAKITIAKQIKLSKIAKLNIDDDYKKSLTTDYETRFNTKLELLAKEIEGHKKAISYDFNDTNSIGNEENRLIEKNSMLATIGLWVLTGGIYGLVSLIVDMLKLKKLNQRLTSKEIAVVIVSMLVPFFSIWTNVIFNRKFKKIGEEMGLDLKMNVVVCSLTSSLLFTLFMDPVSLAYRTNCFNAISDKLTGNNDKVN